MTPEQQRALAMATARRRQAEAQEAELNTHQPATAGPLAAPAAGLGRGLRLGVQDVGRGVSNILGFPGDVLGMVGDVLREAQAGAVDLAGFPETGQAVRDTLGQIPNPLPTGDELKQAAGDDLRSVFGQDILIPDEDRTPRERIVGQGVELGTEALAGSAGVIRNAPNMVGTFLNPMVTKEVAEAAAGGNAGRTFLGDTMAGFGAGAGIGAAQESGVPQALNETSPILGALANMAAAVAGGTGGQVLSSIPAAAAGSKALAPGGSPAMPDPKAVDPQTGEAFPSAISDVAAQFMQGPNMNATGGLARMLEERVRQLREEGVSPGETPTVGMLVGQENPRVAMAEASARQRDPAPFIARDQERHQGARDRLERVAPPGDGRAFTDEFEGRAGERRTVAQAAAEQQRVAAQQQADKRIADLEARLEQAERTTARFEQERAAVGDELVAAGGVNVRERAASDIDEAVNAELTGAQRERSALHQRLADEFGNERVSLAPLQSVLEDMTSDVGPLSDRASRIPSDIVARFKRLAEFGENGEIVSGGETTVRDLSELTKDLRSAEQQARAAGDFTKSDNIRQLRKGVDATIQAHGEASGNPALAGLSRDIKRFETEEFGPRFREGEADRFRRDRNVDPQGRSRTPPSQTAKRFIAKGQPEKAESLRRMISQGRLQDGGEQAIRDFLVSDLVSSGVVNPKDGTISNVKAGKWIEAFGEQTLETAVPGITNEVRDLMRSNNGMEAASARLKADAADARTAARTGTQEAQAGLAADMRRIADEMKLSEQEIEQGALGFALGKSPEKAVASIMADGDPQRSMAKVVAEIGDDEAARTGLKQAVREYLLDKATNADNGLVEGRPVSAAKMSQLFEQHRGALAEVFDETEMNALQQVHSLLKDEKVVKNIQALGGSPTAERDAAAKGAEQQVEAAVKLKFGMLRGGGIMRAVRLLKDATLGEGLRPPVERLLSQAMLDPELAKHLMTRETATPAPGWNRKLLRLLNIEASVDENDEDP